MKTDTFSIGGRAVSMALSMLAVTGGALAAAPTEMQAVASMGPDDAKVQRMPVPQPAAGQVLIHVYAAAVNPVEWKARPIAAGSPPRIPGRDVAGVIAQVGPGVTQFKVSQAIFGEVSPLPNAPINGAYAEYAVAPVEDIALKPRRFTYAEASGLGIATITGVRAVQHAGVAKGQRVLVTGAAGGVGSAAVQAAKARGAYVIGTASGGHAAYLKGLGLDQHVDYTAGDWAARIQNVDAVIDTVSAANATDALRTMKRGGKLVFAAGGPKAEACSAAGVECSGGQLGPFNPPPAPGAAAESAAAGGNPVIGEITRLADAGKLKVVINGSYPLDQTVAAWDAGRKGSAQGKLVMIVDAANANRK